MPTDARELAVPAQQTHTELTDLSDDVLVRILTHLPAICIAKACATCSEWSSKLAEAAATVRAAELGVLLAPWRGAAALQILAVKEMRLLEMKVAQRVHRRQQLTQEETFVYNAELQMWVPSNVDAAVFHAEANGLPHPQLTL